MSTPRKTAIEKATLTLKDKAGQVTSALGHASDLSNRSTEALYEMLARLVGFVRMAVQSEHANHYRQMCKDKGIKEGDNRTSNRFLTPLKAVLTDNEGKNAPSGINKWAQVVRYMIENRVPEEEVVEKIKTAKRENLTKRAAIVKMDSDKNPSKSSNQQAVTDAINTVRGYVTKSEIGRFAAPSDLGSLNVEGLMIFIGERAGNEVVIRQHYNGEDTKLAAMVKNFAPKKDKDQKSKSLSGQIMKDCRVFAA
jgi:hypothetical protein